VTNKPIAASVSNLCFLPASGADFDQVDQVKVRAKSTLQFDLTDNKTIGESEQKRMPSQANRMAQS